MGTKLLLVLGILFGILVVGFLGLQRPADVPRWAVEEGRLVSSGHFVLEQSGVRLLEETYSLFALPNDERRLTSEGTLSVAGARIGIAQQTRYGPGYRPLSYELVAATSQGSQVITAQRGDREFTMEVRSGAVKQTVSSPLSEDLVLLDNNVIAHYVALLEVLRAGDAGRAFSAAVPQALVQVPLRWEEPVASRFTSGSRAYAGVMTTLHLGDTTIDLVSYEGRLVGLVNRTQGTVAYDAILLPGGLSMEEPRKPDESSGIVEREITFESGGLTLAGTLTVPGPQTPSWCAVLFVAGSGLVDRDGNAPGFRMDAYRQLAHRLAADGVASLRYDKRGVGSSEGSLRTASKTDLLLDVRAAWDALEARPEFAGVPGTALGHSEGTYLVEELAAENASVAGLILVCGSPRSLAAVTRWQVETLLRAQGASDDQIRAALEEEDQYLAFVKASSGQWADYTVDALQSELPWLTGAGAEQLKSSTLGLAWLREHYNADPAASLSRIRCPVLVISAGKDAQVPPADGEAAANVVAAAGNQDVSAVLLENLNHVLRHHPEEPGLVYQHLDEPVDARVAATVLRWAQEEFGE
jgi:hypothetical protein